MSTLTTLLIGLPDRIKTSLNLHGPDLPTDVRLELAETLRLIELTVDGLTNQLEQRVRVLTADGHPTTEYPDDPENFETPEARASFVEMLDAAYPHNAPHSLQHAYLTHWEDWT